MPAPKGLYPFPVYEARLSDGTKLRMSFWSPKGAPIDVDRGRRQIERALRSCPSRHFPAGPNEGKHVAWGQVEWRGHRWWDFGQQAIPLPGTTEKRARRPYKRVLAELIAHLDGRNVNPSIVDQARALVAA